MDVRAGENWCGKFVDWRDCTIYQDKCIDGQKYMKKRDGESERHNVTDAGYVRSMYEFRRGKTSQRLIFLLY